MKPMLLDEQAIKNNKTGRQIWRPVLLLIEFYFVKIL
jgi:hypothetical protein